MESTTRAHCSTPASLAINRATNLRLSASSGDLMELHVVFSSCDDTTIVFGWNIVYLSFEAIQIVSMIEHVWAWISRCAAKYDRGVFSAWSRWNPSAHQAISCILLFILVYLAGFSLFIDFLPPCNLCSELPLVLAQIRLFLIHESVRYHILQILHAASWIARYGLAELNHTVLYPDFSFPGARLIAGGQLAQRLACRAWHS